MARNMGGNPDDGDDYYQRRPSANARKIAEYFYDDANGRPYMRKDRLEPKDFRQYHFDFDEREWKPNAPDGPVLPYHLPELLAAPLDQFIYICEGEKDADTLRSWGLVATTAPSAWTPVLNRYVANRKIVVCEDNDEKGRKHGLRIARNVAPNAEVVRILKFPELPEKSDVTDWVIQYGGTKEKFLERCAAAPVFVDEDAPQKITATPFKWQDPTTLPRRQWHYRPAYVASYLGLTLAPGGAGKSSLIVTEILAMASGMPLMGVLPAKRLKVWYANLEDPQDELDRRIAGAIKHYGLIPEDIGDRLFINSGRTTPIVIASEDGRTGVRINTPLIESVIDTIRENGIDVLIVDPFVASHTLSENDNTKIDQASRIWARIAEETGVSIMLVHHLRKTGGERGTVEDGRGASALLATARTARVLNTMTKEEAEGAGIDEQDRRSYFRVDVGKANLSPPASEAQWCKIVSVDLENVEGVDWDQGDRVGVVTAFAYPKAEPMRFTATDTYRVLELIKTGGPWREDQRAKGWVGEAFAKVMKMDLSNRPTRKALVKIVADWVARDLLKVVPGQDGRRNNRDFIEVGPAASDIEPQREE